MADNNKSTQEDDDSSLNEYQKDEIQKTREQAGFQKQIEHELATEERFQKYFEGFNSESVKNFMPCSITTRGRGVACGPAGT